MEVVQLAINKRKIERSYHTRDKNTNTNERLI
jgi:hypothetical protein